MSWSNLDPILAYSMLGVLLFFLFIAYVATREDSPFDDNDITKYTSTFNIKSTLISHLTTWIEEQPDSFNIIAESLDISTEKLEVIIKGRVDLLSVDDLIELLIKTGHQVDVTTQPIDKDL